MKTLWISLTIYWYIFGGIRICPTDNEGAAVSKKVVNCTVILDIKRENPKIS